MTPDEIKARLAVFDEQLAKELAKLGFTPEEISRAMDPSIPLDRRRAETDAILSRHVAAELANPGSELGQAMMARAIDEVERQLPDLEQQLVAQERARQIRRRLWLLGGVGLVVSIGLVLFVVYRLKNQPGNECETLLGPLAEIQQLAGVPLETRGGIGGDRNCDLLVFEAGKAGGWVVMVSSTHRTNFTHLREDRERQQFIGKETLALPTGEGVLFIAGSEQPSTEELQADVMARAAKRRPGGDPMGEALAALPPSQHSILFVHGDAVTELKLDARKFDVAEARTLAQAIAGRAKR